MRSRRVRVICPPVSRSPAQERSEITLHRLLRIIQVLSGANAIDESLYVVNGSLFKGVILLRSGPCVVARNTHETAVVRINGALDTKAADAKIAETAGQLMRAEIGLHVVRVPKTHHEMIPGVPRVIGGAAPIRAPAGPRGLP